MAKTIAAIATPNAAGGIGIIRISGPDAVSVGTALFTPVSGALLSERPGYSAMLGTVRSGETDLDQCIALLFRAPRSYTGEDVVELQCHGGLYLMQRVLRAAFEAGASPAEPGEFTKRAFLNGKLDLSEAESVMGLISAHGEQALSAAYHALGGALSSEIREVTDSLVSASAFMAAWADYPDEMDDEEALEDEVLCNQLMSARTRLNELVSRFDAGQAVTEGVRTAIVGRPNVGKSTLMNLLCGRDRSIVTDLAGTTRDIIDETARIGNVVLHLSDTAGLHESADKVESIGIERAKEALTHADLVIAVFDGSTPLLQEDNSLLEECKHKRCVCILNKSDLGNVVSESDLSPYCNVVLPLSAKDTDSLAPLTEVLEDLLGTADFDSSAAMLQNERQLTCVNKAVECINEALSALTGGLTMDAVNVSVDAAIEPLLELTGERVSDTVVDKVFSTFCVGK